MLSGTVRADAAGNSFLVRVRKSRLAEDPLGHVEAVKLNPSGVVLWTRPLVGDGFGASLALAAVVDGANNLFVSVAGANAFTAPRGYLYKLNGATGAVLWTKSDLPFGTFFVPPLKVDASNNVFVGGTPFGTGDERMTVHKLNGATGAQLWTRSIARTAPGKTDIMTGLAVDGQNNVAVVGYATASNRCGTGPKPMVLSRLRGTDGAVLWTTTYQPAATDDAIFPQCVADASGNVYAASEFRRGVTTTVWALCKRNASNGSTAFSRVVTPAAGNSLGGLTDLVIDAAGVAFIGDAYGGGRNKYNVHRYSTAGAALWNRSLADRNSGGRYYLAAMRRTVRSNSAGVYLSLYDTVSGNPRIARLNGATGATVWDRLLATGNQGVSPVDLELSPGGDPLVTLDTSSGDGSNTVENSRWHRVAAATGSIAATNNGVNSVIPTCDFGSALLLEPGGNSFVLGGSGGRIVAQKVSSAGAVLWQRTVGAATGYTRSGLDTAGRAIARDAAGNVYGAGESGGIHVIFKLNGANGATVYSHESSTYDGDNLAVNSANELYVPGSPQDSLRKLAANGTSLWTARILGSRAATFVKRVVLNSQGVPFVVAETSSFQGCGEPSDDRMVVARLNPTNGMVVWLKELVPPIIGEAEPAGIAIDPAGNVVVAGTFASTMGGSDYFAARLNATTGSPLWSRRYDLGSRFQAATAMVLDGSGNLGITGVSVETSGPAVWTIKALLSSGAQAWSRLTTSPAGSKRADSIARDAAGNFYVTGLVGDTVSTQQFGLKLSGASGAQVWMALCPGGLEAWGYPTAGAVGSGNNLHLLGANASTGTGLSQMTLTKFNP